MEFDFATLLGTVGVAALLAVYFLNLFGKIQTDNYSYILINLFGALLACTASIIIQFLPFIVLEGTWALVSATALARRINRPEI